MNKFNVNIKRLALLLLPTFWRRPIITTIAYASVSPLAYVNTLFVLFRRQTNYRLFNNGQTCRLRAVLNEMFDPIYRQITVTDIDNSLRGLRVFLRQEEKEKLIPKRGLFLMVVNNRGFEGASGYDFQINIPYALSQKLDLPRLKAIVATYKLASKRFTLNYM